MFVFDAWFYATHRLLHLDWFMKHVHHWHHVFIILCRNFMNHQLLHKTLYIHLKPFCKGLWDISSSPFFIQWILFSFQFLAISLLFMPFWLMMEECLIWVIILSIIITELATMDYIGDYLTSFLDQDIHHKNSQSDMYQVTLLQRKMIIIETSVYLNELDWQ